MTTAISNPIQKHLESKRFREERLWKLRDGKWFTIVDGHEFSEEDFNECYPLFSPVRFVKTRENIDSRQEWLRN